MRNLILLCSFILLTSALSAQSFLYGQYQLLPLNLNPAMAGANSESQLTLNLRREGFSLSENTFYLAGAINYDRPFLLKNGDKIGAGIKFNFSKEGSTNGFQNVNPAIDLSYQKRIFKSNELEHFVSGGLEIGYLNRSFFFDSNQGSFAPQNLNAFDIGFGLNYRGELSKGKYLDVGASGFQLTEEILPRMLSINISADLVFSDRIDIRPRILLTSQSGISVITPGVGGRFFFGENDQTSLELGVGGRWLKYNNFGTENILYSARDKKVILKLLKFESHEGFNFS